MIPFSSPCAVDISLPVDISPCGRPTHMLGLHVLELARFPLLYNLLCQNSHISPSLVIALFFSFGLSLSRHHHLTHQLNGLPTADYFLSSVPHPSDSRLVGCPFAHMRPGTIEHLELVRFFTMRASDLGSCQLSPRSPPHSFLVLKYVVTSAYCH